LYLKYLPKTPQVVNYSKEKSEELIDLIIEVQDTGIGISKELQEAIFEPFVQERDHKKYGGTGLGLAITRRLTSLINGTISLHSELGKGSTFTVRIPEISYLRDFSKTIVDIQIDPSEIVFERAVILIADDVDHNRSYIRDALKNTNLKVVEAEADLIGELSNLPGLIHTLETDFYATWKTFAVRQPIGEIRDFGKNLTQLGMDHNSGIITDYSKELVIAADSFNIEAILNYKKIPGNYRKSQRFK